ncbi:YgfZ/GcvT domain-containing protein [Stackebrandtia soli]|uniref:CAF17-like 4Fe-4S cluster assembly/insertion protein YgfZ n=1 Tax=Stackebrandtia soli TaxID=1892856 RepID=UPI0039ED4E03
MKVSDLLTRPGAVGEREDSTVAWHYGDPLREQRALTVGALVDRSDRDIVTVTGADRLTWLHSLTSQHLSALAPLTGTQLLVLSPNGHIESIAGVFDDGTTTWLDTEPGAGAALVDFLTKMRFFTEVDIATVTDDWAMLYVSGDTTLAEPDILPVPPAKFATGTLPPRPTVQYAGETLPDGGFARRVDTLGQPGVDLLVPRSDVASFADKRGLPLSGTWAYDTLRIPALVPAQGVDVDHRTIPQESPWLLARAVHLDKGCYRGQETVARVHNLGRPPRTFAMLHLDGTEEHPPAPGTDIKAGARTVGQVGTAARHYEDGMIALTILKRAIAENPEAQLTINDSAAAL